MQLSPELPQHRRIGQRYEGIADWWRVAAVSVGIEQSYQAFLGIGPVGGAEGAAPGKRSDALGRLVVVGRGLEREAQPELVRQRGELVGEHHRDGLGAQQSHAVQLASIEEELQELRVVLDAGGEPGAAREVGAGVLGIIRVDAIEYRAMPRSDLAAVETVQRDQIGR